jgi:hypothetical protein
MPKETRNNTYDTPQKAKIQGAYEFLAAKGIPIDPREIFDHFNVQQRSGYRIIEDGAPARTRKNQDLNETRGRKSKLSGADIAAGDSLLEEQELGMEAKGMPWGAMVWELNLDVSAATFRRTMGEALGYGKHKAAVKGFLPQGTREARKKWASDMKLKYPNPEDWYRVRFSDEVHAGYGPEGQLWIARKPGSAMRYRHDNIQHRDAPLKKGEDRPRVHAWAAVGYDFKSDLIFYKVPGNTNGKLSHEAYIEQILEPVVRPWVERGDDFVLEEDGDSGHGGGPKARKNNPVAKWKQDMGLNTYFNCHNSPDLAPIENCWQAPKSFVRKRPHYDEQTLMELMREGWEHVTIPYINKQVRSMPQRLHDVIEGDGERTGW